MTKYAVNWNLQEDDFTQVFYTQNTKQTWFPEEINISADKNVWDTLTTAEKETYKKVLGGLTLLDTTQGAEGMPLIGMHIEGYQRKAVISFMGTMEHIHAKSYSRIFNSLASGSEIKDIFEWVESHEEVSGSEELQFKAQLISDYYNRLFEREVSDYDMYMGMVVSVYLESYLFYSGFFYPLYLAGQGKMTAAGEIINLILRDEAIHGVYIGLLAQEYFERLSEGQKRQAVAEREELLVRLYDNEELYTEKLYADINLVEEVKEFVRYNANKACMNLGFAPYFEQADINPIVENGLNTETKTHDFFSVKGNGYVKSVNVISTTDEDFTFEWLNEEAVEATS